MRRTRILTAVLTLAAGLLAGTPPALATSDSSARPLEPTAFGFGDQNCAVN
ncbi:hypothetical protein AB5J55_35545 [Streptomyces sp. R11]|uniref:Chitinase n=1 Tax=Streptomyces sp. R11 TaxID=3238625 RepID=A0AB39NCH1_9ACTN